MNILFVTETSGFHGGVEQYVYDAARGLAARGHACHLAYGHHSRRGITSFERAFESASVAAELLDGDADVAPRLDQIIEGLAPDAIYVHKISRLPDALLEGAGGARVVRMIHDHDLTCPRRHRYHPVTGRVCGLRAGWWCAAEGAFLTRDKSRVGWRRDPIGPKLAEIERNHGLNLTLVGSRYMRRQLLNHGFEAARVHRLPPVGPFGVPQPTPHPPTPHLLYVGQLIRGKGVDLLLEALALAGDALRATIVGAGSAETALREQAEHLGLSHRVRFMGWVDHAHLDGFYRRASMVAVPSRWPEPFGMVGLEAMHHSRPVVAFDVGGISDWLCHGVTGFLAPEGDVAALSDGIRRLASDPALAARMGGAGRRRAQALFDHQRHLVELEAHLASGAWQHRAATTMREAL